jgi:hypothetical protein
MPKDLPDKMPDRMSEEIAEDMSDRMPEDLPGTKRIDVMVGITRSQVLTSSLSSVPRFPFCLPLWCYYYLPVETSYC